MIKFCIIYSKYIKYNFSENWDKYEEHQDHSQDQNDDEDGPHCEDDNFNVSFHNYWLEIVITTNLDFAYIKKSAKNLPKFYLLYQCKSAFKICNCRVCTFHLTFHFKIEKYVIYFADKSFP